MRSSHQKKSALSFILLGLIPYSRQNLILSFSPTKFFNQLENTSGYKQPSLKAAYKRGQKRGLIVTTDKNTRLTTQGLRQIQPFIAKKLSKQIALMVIFDIPEQNSSARTKFRRLLKHWQFEQVQKSVWSTEYDYREPLLEVIAELKLEECVQLYESARILSDD